MSGRVPGLEGHREGIQKWWGWRKVLKMEEGAPKGSPGGVWELALGNLLIAANAVLILLLRRVWV